MRFSLFSKKHTACPYCYSNLDMNRVAFRCSGHGEPGLPACGPVEDQRRSRILGQSDPVWPSIGPLDNNGMRLIDPQTGLEAGDLLGKKSAQCQRCGGTSRIRICPNCHEILPSALDNSSPLFGLIGERNSGKTVLLSVLHKELTGNIGRRFDASITAFGGVSGLVADLQHFEESMSGASRRLPEQTQSSNGQRKPPAVYEWKQSVKGRIQSTIFSFYDTAGEDVSSLERIMTQKYLDQVSGVILLLDPFSFPENRPRARQLGFTEDQFTSPEAVIGGITQVLRQSRGIDEPKKIDVPVAVVVSKIDAFFDQIDPQHPLRNPDSREPIFDNAQSLSNHDYIASLVANWGGDSLLRTLEHNYSNYRLFGVSALGAEPDYRTMTVNSGGVQPLHVADPILWLLAERKFIPTENS